MPPRIDERPLQVESQHLRTRASPHCGLQRRKDRLGFIRTVADRAHEERRHAVSRRPCGICLDACPVLCEKRMSATAVYVHIDEPGSNLQAVRIQHTCPRHFDVPADGHHLATLAEHIRTMGTRGEREHSRLDEQAL